MLRSLLLAFVLSPIVAASAFAQQEPTQGQKDFIKTLIIFGRVQAACSLYNNNVLAPAITKQFIEANFKDLPGDRGSAMRSELKAEDPKCSSVLN